MFGYSLARAVRGGFCLGSILVSAPLLAYADTPQVFTEAKAPSAESELEPSPGVLREEHPPAPVPTAPTAQPAQPVSTALRQQDKGFALLCNFSARLFMIAADGSNTPSQTALQGGIFGGYKRGRLLLGMGFDLSNFNTETVYSDGTNSAKGVVSNTGLVFSPGVQVALLRSSDQRLELIGAAQVGLGSIISRSYQEPELPPELQVENNQRTLYLQYRIAPGLRVWALPQLALNLLTGFSGDHLFTFINNPSGNQTDQRASTAFFVNLGAMGVF